MGIDDLLNTADGVINYLPRKGAEVMDDGTPQKKVLGTALGYGALLLGAAAIPFDGGLFFYAALVGSPALAGYRALKGKKDE